MAAGGQHRGRVICIAADDYCVEKPILLLL